VQQPWRQFLEQRGYTIAKGLGAERAVAPAPAAADAATTCCVDLNHFTALRLVGPDAAAFLQGYLTCDVKLLQDAQALFGAYTNIKGRVVADTIVLLTDGQPTLLVHASLRDGVLASLRKYLAFSRSKFADATSAPILLGIINPPDALALPVQSLTVAPFRGGFAVAVPGPQRRVVLLLPLEAATATWLEYDARGETADASNWDLLDVREGIAHVCTATSEVFLPQMLDYDRLNAISFTKGCYLGQEIVARTQHLGRTKRHLQRLRWAGAPAPAVGAELYGAGDVRAGTVVSVACTGADAGVALAVINDSIAAPLHAGAIKFTLQ